MKIFDRARLTLTAWYLLIIMLVSAAFSVLVYRAATAEFDRFARMQKLRIEREFPGEPYRLYIVEPELVTETRHRLRHFLFIINGTIFVLAGALGYFLAGKTLQPIQEMVDDQNQFISDASHELKTPLTAMRTSLEVSVRDKKLAGSEAKRILEDNLKEVIDLQRLSENLLELTHKNGQSFQDVSVDEIVERATREVASLAKSHAITIKELVAAGLTVRGHDLTLTRALVAVLDNAIKYSEEGKEIAVRAHQKGKTVHISVKDHGFGISSNDLEHITERFYRGDKSRKTNGYGLGLSIVDKTIKSHKGKLAITSKSGIGTTVTITLPTSA